MVLLRSPAQWDDVGKARGHRRPGGFWCRQERDDGDGLLAVGAVAGRGGFERVSLRGVSRGGSARWFGDWREIGQGQGCGRSRQCCSSESASPVLVAGLVSFAFGVLAAGRGTVDLTDGLG
ncbi:hypothetical protein Sros01_67780 [Streptomyces roseochromogenus]|nr:hypothetical protein Sros01_67780 [Streptomyces roseochromogenus]